MTTQPNTTQLNLQLCEALGIEPTLDWQVMSPDESASCLSGTKAACEQWLADHIRRYPESHYANYHVGAWKRYPDHFSNTSSSLWACHQAEKTLTPEQRVQYFTLLSVVLKTDAQNWHKVDMPYDQGFLMTSATPPQRALALHSTLCGTKSK